MNHGHHHGRHRGRLRPTMDRQQHTWPMMMMSPDYMIPDTMTYQDHMMNHKSQYESLISSQSWIPDATGPLMVIDGCSGINKPLALTFSHVNFGNPPQASRASMVRSTLPAHDDLKCASNWSPRRTALPSAPSIARNCATVMHHCFYPSRTNADFSCRSTLAMRTRPTRSTADCLVATSRSLTSMVFLDFTCYHLRSQCSACIPAKSKR